MSAVSVLTSVVLTLHAEFFLHWIWVLYLPLFAFGYLILAVVFVMVLRWPVARRGSRALSVAAAVLTFVGFGGSLFLFVGTPEPGPYNGFGIPLCPTV